MKYNVNPTYFIKTELNNYNVTVEQIKNDVNGCPRYKVTVIILEFNKTEFSSYSFNIKTYKGSKTAALDAIEKLENELYK